MHTTANKSTNIDRLKSSLKSLAKTKNLSLEALYTLQTLLQEFNDNLKQIDHSKAISVLNQMQKLLNPSFYDSLLTDENAKTLYLYILRSLEVQTNLGLSIESHIKKAQKKVLSIYTSSLNLLQDPSYSNLCSEIYTISLNPEMPVEHIDISLVLLKILLNLLKSKHSPIEEKTIEIVYFYYLTTLKSNQDFVHLKFSLTSAVSCEKYIKLLTLLREMPDSQSLSNVILETREKLKELFMVSLKIIIMNSPQFTSINLNPSHMLRELFTEMLEFLLKFTSTHSSYHQFYDIPVIIVHLILAEIPKIQQYDLHNQLKSLVLTMLLLFYQKKFLQFPESIDIGLEDLLLSNFLFEDNQLDQQETWEELLKVVCDNLITLDSFVRAVSSNILLNINNYSYLSGVNQMINSVFSVNKIRVDESSYFILITDLIQVIVKENIETNSKEMIFQILNFIFEFAKLSHDHQIRILNVFIKEVLPRDPQNSYFFPGILSKIMKNADFDMIKMVISMIESSSNEELIELLIMAVSKLLISEDALQDTFKKLISAGFTAICTKKLCKKGNFFEVVKNWEDTFELLKMIRVKSGKSKLEFPAKFIIGKFRELDVSVRKMIIEKISENLVRIVFARENEQILVPSCTALITEFLVTCENESQMLLLNTLNCSEFFLFIQNDFLSIILYHISRSPLLSVFDLIQEKITMSIKYFIKFQDFTVLISLLNSASPRRLFLLKILKNSLSMKNKSLSFSKSLVVPNVTPITLKLNSVKTQIPSIKTFTIYFWFFAVSNCEIVTLSFTGDYLTVLLENSHLKIKVFNNVHAESEKLDLNIWYLLLLSCTISKNDRKYSFFISTNSKKIFKNEFSIKSSLINDIQVILLGGGNVKSTGNNRIKNFYLCYKAFGSREVIEIMKISWRYSLMNFPENQDVDMKIVNEIRESFWLTWENITESFKKKERYLEDPHIFDVIRAYSGTRLLFELFERTNDLRELFEIFSICERILCFSNYFYIVSEDFVTYLGYYFNKKLIDTRLNEVFLDIIKSAPKKFDRVLLDSYLTNTKSMFLLKQSKRIDEVISTFFSLKPISKVNLLNFCKVISGLSLYHCVGYLKRYLNNNVEKYDEEVAAVLIYSAKSDNIWIIKFFLEVIMQDTGSIKIDSKLFVAMLHIIDTKQDTDLQISITKLICHKINYEKNEERPESIIDMISHILPDQIPNELFEYLLSQGFENDKYKLSLKGSLVSIALSRVKVITNPQQLQYIISKLAASSNKLIILLVYNSDIFPSWLLFGYKYLPFKEELKEITRLILNAAINTENQDLGKIQEIFAELLDFDLYLNLFENLADFSIYKCFQFFCVLWIVPKDSLEILIDDLLNVLARFRSSEKFMAAVEASININYISHKIQESGSNEKPCLIAGEIMKFYLHLLKNQKGSQKILEDLNSFLSSEQIRFFSKYYNTQDPALKSKESCEVYMSLFLFYTLVKHYYKYPKAYEPIIESFISVNRIFSTISSVMNENLSTSLFYRISISKSTAIIPSGALSMNSSEKAQINEFDDYCFGLDYDTLKENSKICEFIYSNKQSSIFEVIDKNNPAWKVIYNSLQIATKNYKLIDNRCRTSIFQAYSEDLEQYDSSNIHRNLNKLLEDSWFELYSEENEKNLFKIEYDLSRYSKIYYRSLEVMNGIRPEKVSVRQCYDKLYRWVFLKRKRNKEHISQRYSLPLITSANTELELEESLSVFSHAFSEQEIQTENTSFFSFSCAADYIKVQGTCFGKISINKSYFEYTSKQEIKPIDSYYMYSSLECSMLLKKIRHIWNFSEISEVVLKKFIHHHSTFELVLSSGKSYLFNVFSEATRRELVSYFSIHKSIQITGRSVQSEIKPFTDDWKKNKISNFEYLMQLNKLSSRTFHDICQYPVFPFLITDYSKQAVSIEDFPLRNLSYPVSAQNEKVREEGIRKYESWSDDCISPFIFGSHYSSSGVVLHYMLRLEPYTEQAKQLQSGSFDVGDRLFYSLDKSWDSTQQGSGDCKELIPELFYQPWCLKSFAQIVFGTTSAGQKITDVDLPVWAISCYDFIKKHLILLESPLVSQGLPSWIDLIFGCKQQGERALQFCNIYCAETYENYFSMSKGKISEFELQSIIEKIYHFGQTPSCIFRNKLHGKKEEVNSEGVGVRLSADLEVSLVDREEKHKGRIISGKLTQEHLVTIRYFEGCVTVSRIKAKAIEDNAYFSYNEYALKLLNINRNDINKADQAFALFNENVLVSGLNTANSVMVHTMKGELVQVLSFHTQKVTAVAAGADQIFSGSLDSTVVSWKYNKSFSIDKSFHGHYSEVIQVKLSEKFCVVVSASQSGVLIHDTRSAECLVKIQEKIENLELSDFGFIFLNTQQFLKFFHITGGLIYEESLNEQVFSAKFSQQGDCFLVLSDRLLIKDSTDSAISHFYPVAKVCLAAPSHSTKSLVIWKNLSEAESVISTCKLSAKTTKKLFVSSMI